MSAAGTLTPSANNTSIGRQRRDIPRRILYETGPTPALADMPDLLKLTPLRRPPTRTDPGEKRILPFLVIRMRGLRVENSLAICAVLSELYR